MPKRFSIGSMICLLLAAGLLITSLFFPWWGMELIAAQYPEGLNIIVYPNKLDGEIDIVNSLNHYIGMAEFSTESFPELQYLPYLIIGFAILILLIALTRRKGLLYVPISIFVIGGILGIYDMNRWLTKFGTELDPKAPIDSDPFVPPIIGENTIANFVTHSYFTTGAFILVAAAICTILPIWLERRKK